VHFTEFAVVTLVVVKVDMRRLALRRDSNALVGTGLNVQVSCRTWHVHWAFPFSSGSPHFA
jgi:hypothetical protein